MSWHQNYFFFLWNLKTVTKLCDKNFQKWNAQSKSWKQELTEITILFAKVSYVNDISLDDLKNISVLTQYYEQIYSQITASC